MPKAVISVESERHDLESCPDGFVEIKRMSYGKWLHRQEMAMQLSISSKGSESEGKLAMANRAVTLYEFQQCIVDHNLEDAEGKPLDFNKPYTLDLLDPRIGNEIAGIINGLHRFEAETENLLPGSDLS